MLKEEGKLFLGAWLKLFPFNAESVPWVDKKFLFNTFLQKTHTFRFHSLLLYLLLSANLVWLESRKVISFLLPS